MADTWHGASAGIPDPWTLPLETFDVSKAELFEQDLHWEYFRRLRQEAPVHYCPESLVGAYWSVTKYNDIVAVDTNHHIFSSEPAIGIGDPSDGITPPMFIAMDPPLHDIQRKAAQPAVAPGQLAELESLIRTRVINILDSLPTGERFNWVDKVSIELTTGMLAILFDFPWEDRRLLTFWSDWAGDVELSLARPLDEERRSILHEMAAYFQQLWNQRANEDPKPDLISMMIHSPAMNQMSPMEFMGNLVLLIVGGNDTTRNTMSGIIHALDKFPDQRKLFEQQPDLIPNAVQECIRYQTPLAHMRRTATEDSDLFGHAIKKGDKLILWYLSANRDEQVFDEPDKLDITRENARRHLSFGYGIHRCVGARLAELQLRILLEEMHKRRMRVHVAGDVERVRANFVHGFRKLEVEITSF